MSARKNRLRNRNHSSNKKGRFTKQTAQPATVEQKTETSITSINTPIISVENNITAMNSEAYHHILSDIYDYFENRASLWDCAPRIADIVFGIGGTGIVSYIISNNVTEKTTILQVWQGNKSFVLMIVGSVAIYVIDWVVRKKKKLRTKEGFFEKFESASQIKTMEIKTQITPVSSSNALNLNTSKADDNIKAKQK